MFFRPRLAIGCAALLLLASLGGAHKIKHIVVLMEENRSFDHLLGWAGSILGIDGLTGREFNPTSTLFPHLSKNVYVDKNAPMVARCDPDHATSSTTSKIFGYKEALSDHKVNASMVGFIETELLKSLGKSNCDVLSMFEPAKVPVLITLAKEFAIMDKFFASVPGPTWPNRQFAMAATSGGSTETFNWYQGTVGRLFPQRTIFDQLEAANMTWRNYYFDTPWELFMEKLAHSPDNIVHMEEFFAKCASGDLPTYSFLNPHSAINVTTGEGSDDMHPDHDVAAAEGLIKRVYEAVRASPAWNETLLIVTFDEHGGFYDHVPPPMDGVPPPDGNAPFPDVFMKFDRLGIRIPTLLISPWIAKGTVISDPPAAQKPFPTSQYDLTSIIATARKLLGIREGNLTARDGWAATFEHALNTTGAHPRTDCPLTMPQTHPIDKEHAAQEASQPLNSLQEFMMRTLADLHGYDPATPLHHHAGTQGRAGVWLRDHFHAHQRRRRAYVKDAHAQIAWVAPTLDLVWLTGVGHMKFDLNKNPSGAPGLTVSTRGFNSPGDNGTAYCLDRRTTDGLVTASPCYPSVVPGSNQARTQLWTWNPDATIRPLDDPSLCVTTRVWEGIGNVTVAPCNGGVQQSYLYFGPGAAGNPDLGMIQWGNGIYAFGVVPADHPKA